MAGYREKGEVELAWLEAREQIALQGRQLLRRVLDVALVQLDKEFNAALHQGKIVDITLDKDELRDLLLRSAKRELGNGK